jgi:hypothetical protein
MVGTLVRDARFAARFVEYLLSRIIRIEEDLVDQFFNFSERRLARVLLLLGQVNEESRPECPLKVVPRAAIQASFCTPSANWLQLRVPAKEANRYAPG